MAYIYISQYCHGHVNKTNIAIVVNMHKFDIGLHFVKNSPFHLRDTQLSGEILQQLLVNTNKYVLPIFGPWCQDMK